MRVVVVVQERWCEEADITRLARDYGTSVSGGLVVCRACIRGVARRLQGHVRDLCTREGVQASLVAAPVVGGSLSSSRSE